MERTTWDMFPYSIQWFTSMQSNRVSHLEIQCMITRLQWTTSDRLMQSAIFWCWFKHDLLLSLITIDNHHNAFVTMHNSSAEKLKLTLRSHWARPHCNFCPCRQFLYSSTTSYCELSAQKCMKREQGCKLERMNFIVWDPGLRSGTL